jgi:hypothetical protein
VAEAATRRGLGKGALWCGVIVCAAILCFLCIAPRANAAWSPPVDVVKQHGVGGPLIATDSAGNTVFMWQQGGIAGTLYTRSRMADGALTPIQRITPPGEPAWSPHLAVDPAGDAYFVWQVFDGPETKVRARVRSADGTLGPVQTVASKKSYDDKVELAAVGVGANGRAVFSWVRENNIGTPVSTQARSRSKSGQLGPVRTVAAQGATGQMAVDASGNATFVWEVSGDEPDAIWTRILTAAGTLSEPKRVSRVGGNNARDPHVGVSRQGRAVIEWHALDGSLHPVLMVRRRAPDGSLQPSQLLAKGDTPNLDLAVAPNGAAIFCWEDGKSDLRARGLTSGGTLGPVRTVAPSSPGLCQPGIDAHGTVAFAWTASDGSKSRVYARSGTIDGTLGPVQILSPAGFNAGSADLTVGPDGTAPVAWSLGRKGFAIQAAFGP